MCWCSVSSNHAGGAAREQIEHLFDVQVVADGHGSRPLRDEELGGQRVGDVEREVADSAQARLARKSRCAPRLRMSTPSGSAFSISLKNPARRLSECAAWRGERGVAFAAGVRSHLRDGLRVPRRMSSKST